MVETLERAELAVVDVAALFVETDGVYYGLDGADPWDADRDARLYAGPWPVVAHPPCARWTKPLAFINQARYGYMVGDDGGCFASALDSVRRYGGVLEHPAQSAAWDRFHLPKPGRGGWTSSFDDGGYTSEIEQHFYGHPCEKKTWLYYVGPEPPPLIWRRSPQGSLPVVSRLGNAWRTRGDLRYSRSSITPEAFRDVLLNMARTAPAAVPVPDTRESTQDFGGKQSLPSGGAS